MPHFFFGTIGRHKKPKLFGPSLEVVTERSWLRFTEFGKLTPNKGLNHVARLWHIPEEDHSALSWMDNGVEQTIFLPGIQNRYKAIEIARNTWGHLIPSPITFRIKEAVWELS